MAQVNDKLLSDLSRKALKGDATSFHLLMKILNELDHPILDEIDRRASNTAVLKSVLLPLSTLILDNPKPRIQIQSITWQTGTGRPHSTDGPAEMWFDDPYISYAINGLRHREDGPAVVDLSNGSISYFLKGKPRTHEKGPFKVERHEGHVMLTYVMNERMQDLTRTELHNDGLSGWGDDDASMKYTDEPGEHVIVTSEYIDIEGVGKSEPSEKDLENLRSWGHALERLLIAGSRQLTDYLDTFR